MVKTTEKTLRNKAISSVLWSAFQKYSSMIISFISGIILARLLTPFDYGCIGMLSIFMLLSESFIDSGFGSALIQKKEPTQKDYSTIFWWNMAVSFVLYWVLFFSAPLVARFYHIPQLSLVLRVQGGILFIYAFNIVQRNQLKKHLNFKMLSKITIVTSLIALVVTVIMAYNGCGVWSLVAQNIIITAIPSIVFWFFVKWRPIFIFSWKSFMELFSFGFYMFLVHILNTFSNQIQGLLIGRLYSPATMGYYSKASSTEKLASTSISSVISQVSYPLYASINDDRSRLISVLRKITTTLSYLTTPLMLLLCLCAKPLFVFLYSEKWLESVPYFQVLCLAGVAYCLQAVNNQTVAAIGKSRVMFYSTLFKRIVGIGIVVGGLILWGMKGLLIGVVVNTWFAYFVNITVVSKYVGYSNIQQLKDILPAFFVSGIAYVVSYFGSDLLGFDLYGDAFVKIAIFLIIYMGWSLICKPVAFRYTVSTIKRKK